MADVQSSGIEDVRTDGKAASSENPLPVQSSPGLFIDNGDLILDLLRRIEMHLSLITGLELDEN